MHFLQVENLTHSYSVAEKNSKPAINNISFNLERGEILGIIGHTGSGKSTLVSHLNGLLKPDSGRILLDGKDIWENPKDISKVRAKIGLVFQYPEYQLFEESVYKDIAFGPNNLGFSAEEIDKRIKGASELLGISEELFQKSPFDLSGGQKRRVAIAGVVAMEPELIIFDEPTAGLDPEGRRAVLKSICEYRHNKNAAVIIVSHSMEEMAKVCDKILVMNNGSLFSFGQTSEVFANVNKLKDIGLDVPIITQVFLSLNEKYNLCAKNILTVEEAVKFLLPLISKGGSLDD